MELPQFDTLYHDIIASLAGRDLFVQQCHAGADPQYRLPIRVVTEYAWHSLFARNLFLVDRPDEFPRSGGDAPFTVIDSPSFKADPSRHGTASDVVIALNFARRLVLIGGTSYAGEIKKSIFSVLNYLLPLKNVLSMHCSANIGAAGDVALFFGLSGTGKTTLSSDPDRRLIGDDEHGWSDHGVFNFEGGCYAKTIRLSPEAEPQIYATTRRFGTVLENVAIDDVTRGLDLDDDELTENTRAAYPIDFIDNAVPEGQGGHPSNVVMLTADAFGVLPPIARLSPAAAMYHFLSGYTAKVAGTEKGVTEPKATFSTCFGAPFLPLPPGRYATMLGEKIARHQVARLAGEHRLDRRRVRHRHAHEDRLHARDDPRGALRRARQRGLRDATRYSISTCRSPAPMSRPTCCSRARRGRDGADYDAAAAKLAQMFRDNFKKFEAEVLAGRCRLPGRRRHDAYEPVIGLEIHAQLQTATKIFCGCSTAFGAPPNTHVCPVCLGFPGVLPVLNRAAVDFGVRAALALGCRINATSIFARKNYFYPDLPKGYQISQYDQPLASEGVVEFVAADRTCRVGITRVHLEEDAGKSLHEGFPDSDRKTYVDFNRSGVPLIEIVTEPDLRSAADASEFFARLRGILVWLGVNDGNMEEGSLRCDANVSLRPAGSAALGTKAEVKNLNSFRFVQKALEYEIERQRDLLEDGGRVVQETRLFDANAGITVSMRSKEEAHDYRYFPEPDLPPVMISEQRLAVLRRDAGTAGGAAPAVRRGVPASGVRCRPVDADAGHGELLRRGRAGRRAAQGCQQLDDGRAGARAERVGPQISPTHRSPRAAWPAC